MERGSGNRQHHGMTFKKDVRLEPGQVRDLRGQGGSGRRFGLPGGFNFPGGGGSGNGGGGSAIPAGGGIGVVVLIVIVIVILFIANGGLGAPQASTDQGGGQQVGGDTLTQECQTGADANERL